MKGKSRWSIWRQKIRRREKILQLTSNPAPCQVNFAIVPSISGASPTRSQEVIEIPSEDDALSVQVKKLQNNEDNNPRDMIPFCLQASVIENEESIVISDKDLSTSMVQNNQDLVGVTHSCDSREDEDCFEYFIEEHSNGQENDGVSVSRADDTDADGANHIPFHHVDQDNRDDPDHPEGNGSDNESHVDNNDRIPFHPGDPDNPGDPDDPGNNERESDSEGDDDPDLEGDNFTFDDVRLNAVCRPLREMTVREVLALLLAITVRHRLTYEALLDFFRALNILLGKKYFPTDKKQLWRWLHRSSYGIKEHVYCRDCHRRLGLRKNLDPEILCLCGKNVIKKNAAYFVELQLQKQLNQVLQKADGVSLLINRDDRHQAPGIMTDLVDAQGYKSLQEAHIVGKNDFSYTFNTDGASLSQSSKLKVWPLYIKWNELKPNVRQRFMFLNQVWVDWKDPPMNLFLEPFVNQANALSAEGISWLPHNELNNIQSKFIPTACVVDSKARCAMLNMEGPTSYCGCTFCKHKGLYRDGCVRFPILPPVPLPTDFTDAEIRNYMEDAFRTGESKEGVKGPSALMNLTYFDLVKGLSTDDLHPIFLGVTKAHTLILLSSANERQPYFIGSKNTRAVINARLKSIRTPTLISRKPRSIDECANWTGTEWRNWLLIYSVPCLRGILPAQYLSNIERLAAAVFLISQDCVDVNVDCDVAEKLLFDYVVMYEKQFGRGCMTFNVHVLLHVVSCVRQWGPSRVHSTFTFESWNHHIIENVKSPKAAATQIVNRFLINKFINSASENEQISEEVRFHIHAIMNHIRVHEAVRVGDVCALDKGEYRKATNLEQQLLAGNGFHCQNVIEYRRALRRNIEFRSKKYRYGGEVGKDDNSHVYTFSDMFARIESILYFECDNVTKIMFVANVYNTDRTFTYANYIARVGAGEPMYELFEFNEVQSFAVKVTCAAETHLVPIASLEELD